MNYLDQWARETLSPENQEKFFAQQKQIQEDCEQIERWHYRPQEAMGLSSEQQEFLEQHEITISTAYIGMVRFYIGNRTIFQTSAMDTIASALTESLDEGFRINYASLSRQTHEYLNLLMAATPEVQQKLLENNMPLFAAGQLDQVRQMCMAKKGSL